MLKKIHLIAAARPNFMKIAPLYHALIKEDWEDTIIVHTGQHYDLNMSDVFLKTLDFLTRIYTLVWAVVLMPNSAEK